jgi:DNA-binding beta-propeller fold protein YncE
VWVANNGSNSVTELSASTGKRVRVISGARYGLSEPGAISSDGRHVWVTNLTSVTELRARRWRPPASQRPVRAPLPRGGSSRASPTP